MIVLCHIVFAKHVYCGYSDSFIKYCAFLIVIFAFAKAELLLDKMKDRPLQVICWHVAVTCLANLIRL